LDQLADATLDVVADGADWSSTERNADL